MKPSLDRALEVCAITLMGEVAPGVAPSYRQAGVMSMAVLMSCVREELDRIAERRIEESDALRALFGDAAPQVADAALSARLVEAATSRAEGFRISQLDAANDALRALLIELQAHVEETEGDAARALEARIWQELSRSTERRRLSLGSF